MKILFFINGIYLGGKERRMIELMKELKKMPQFSFELVVMNDEINYTEIHDLNIKIHFLIRKTKKDFSIFSNFYKICKEYKPDIIHCWDNMTAIYSIPSRILLNIKLVNGMVVDSPLQQNVFNKNWLRARICFRFSDIIIANSKSGLSAYNAPKQKSAVIYNGYNFNRNNNIIDKDNIRSQLKITTPIIIGMVATFSEYKDYKTYYNAAKIILQKRNDLTFLAIGNNTDSLASKELINDEIKNHFRLLGKESGIESFINIFDVGVLATFTEGISNSILEYMAMEKPVVATSGGGTSEILLDNKTGFLVKAGDPEILAQKIEYLINNPSIASQMGKNGKERVSQLFSIDQMIKKYVFYYNGLINTIDTSGSFKNIPIESAL